MAGVWVESSTIVTGCSQDVFSAVAMLAQGTFFLSCWEEQGGLCRNNSPCQKHEREMADEETGSRGSLSEISWTAMASRSSPGRQRLCDALGKLLLDDPCSTLVGRRIPLRRRPPSSPCRDERSRGSDGAHANTLYDVLGKSVQGPFASMERSGEKAHIGQLLVEQGVVKPGDEVVFLPTHTAVSPCTGKVVTGEMQHQCVWSKPVP